MDPNLVKVFLSCEAIGETLYSNFIDKRFGEVSVWEPLKKAKLPTTNIHVMSCNINTKEGVVNIREERTLMNRLVVASRTQQDIDLPFYYGEYTFSVFPRSVFNIFGVLKPNKDKSSLLHAIKGISSAGSITDAGELTGHDNKVIVFDKI